MKSTSLVNDMLFGKQIISETRTISRNTIEKLSFIKLKCPRHSRMQKFIKIKTWNVIQTEDRTSERVWASCSQKQKRGLSDYKPRFIGLFVAFSGNRRKFSIMKNCCVTKAEMYGRFTYGLTGNIHCNASNRNIFEKISVLKTECFIVWVALNKDKKNDTPTTTITVDLILRHTEKNSK